jgi:hypothetical protein
MIWISAAIDVSSPGSNQTLPVMPLIGTLKKHNHNDSL